MIEEPMVVSLPFIEERWTQSILSPITLELAVRLTVSREVYTVSEPSTPILLPNSAPPLQDPLSPAPWNNECLKNIRELELGQKKADPLQIVNPLPVTLQVYTTVSPGQVQLLTWVSCPCTNV